MQKWKSYSIHAWGGVRGMKLKYTTSGYYYVSISLWLLPEWQGKSYTFSERNCQWKYIRESKLPLNYILYGLTKDISVNDNTAKYMFAVSFSLGT